MSVTANQFIELANTKLEESTSEIENRSIVHLLYYGLYHHGYALANLVRYSALEREHGSAHKKLQDFFFDLSGANTALISQENIRKFKRLSYKMKTMHDKRVIADYALQYDCDNAFITQLKKEFDSCLELILEIGVQGSADEQPALAQG